MKYALYLTIWTLNLFHAYVKIVGWSSVLIPVFDGRIN